MLTGSLEAGAESDKLTVYIYWPTDSGNECNLQNGKYASDATAETVGSLFIDLTITASATQFTKEEDSFDNQYDKTAGIVSMPSGSGLTYSGNEQPLVSGGSATIGTFKYAVSDSEPASDDDYSETLPTRTEAGTYRIWYKVDVGNNYTSIDPACVAANITKASQTISAPTATNANITATKVTLTALEAGKVGAAQYAKSTSTTAPSDGWQTSNVFENLTENTTYYFFAKYEGNKNYNAVTSAGTEIKTPLEVNYLTFTANQDNSAVTLALQGESLEYSENGEGWTKVDVSGSRSTIMVTLEHQGDYVQFRGTNCKKAENASGGTVGSIAASGSITSLIDGKGVDKTVTLQEKQFQHMFSGFTGLTTAPALPATTLANSCYKNMFCECTKLTTAPALSAATLADYCYAYMFYGCTSLTTAMATLPAQTLKTACYIEMFSGCTALTTAPTLAAQSVSDYSYFYMFNNCSNLNVQQCSEDDPDKFVTIPSDIGSLSDPTFKMFYGTFSANNFSTPVTPAAGTSYKIVSQ